MDPEVVSRLRTFDDTIKRHLGTKLLKNKDYGRKSSSKSVYDIHGSPAFLEKYKHLHRQLVKENLSHIINAKDLVFGFGENTFFFVKFKNVRIPFFANLFENKYTLRSKRLYSTHPDFVYLEDDFHLNPCFEIIFDNESKESEISFFMPNEQGCKKNVPPYMYMELADELNENFGMKKCILEDVAAGSLRRDIKTKYSDNTTVPLSLVTLLKYGKTFYDLEYQFVPTKKTNEMVDNLFRELHTKIIKERHTSNRITLLEFIIKKYNKAASGEETGDEFVDTVAIFNGIWSTYFPDPILMVKTY